MTLINRLPYPPTLWTPYRHI